MTDVQTLLSALDRDNKSGKLLPTPQLVQTFQAMRPLDAAKMAMLAQCLEECSEQIYEFYRELIDIFREDISCASPDEQTVLTGIALGILDDEEWPLTGGMKR